MARSINTIFNEMVSQKNNTPALSSLTSSSVTAIWRLLFYVVAYAIHVHESLWDEHKKEVSDTIDEMLPHRPKWYRDKALAFMKDTTLMEDSDQYDTTGMSEEDITSRQVVKHATANESDQSSWLIIKVAGVDATDSTKRAPISQAEEVQLSAYLQEIKDAGVRIALVNEPADEFRCEVDIYYDPTREPISVKSDCEQAIREYVENLSFNGVYSNMALIDALQAVDGVKIAEMRSSESTPASIDTFAPIDAYAIPTAGYFHVASTQLNMIAHSV